MAEQDRKQEKQVREMVRLITGEVMDGLKILGMKKGAPEPSVLGPEKDG